MSGLNLVPEPNWSTLREIKVYKKYRTEGKHILEAEWDMVGDALLPNCPECLESRPDYESKGWVSRKGFIKDRPVDNAPLFIDLKSRKYQCEHCGKTFGSGHPDLKKHSNLTIALIRHIVEHSVGKETHASIARRTGVHESTVRKYLKKRTDELNRGRDRHISEALGIDGVKAGNSYTDETDKNEGELSTVVASLRGEKTSVIGLLPNQNRKALKRFLEEKISPRGDVLPVVIDMDRTYRKAIREAKLPTVIVIDRYHVARRANLALRDAKSELLNTSGIENAWEDMKEDIEEAQEESQPVVGPSAQMTLLDSLSQENEENVSGELKKMKMVLKAGWHFRAIMTCRSYSRKEALDKYREWKRGLDPAIRGFLQSRVIDTVESDLWRDGIMNFFEYPYTNGWVEGINGRIKEIKRIGGGYSNRVAEAKIRSSDSFRMPVPGEAISGKE
jgi:transposase